MRTHILGILWLIGLLAACLGPSLILGLVVAVREVSYPPAVPGYIKDILGVVGAILGAWFMLKVRIPRSVADKWFGDGGS